MIAFMVLCLLISYWWQILLGWVLLCILINLIKGGK